MAFYNNLHQLEDTIIIMTGWGIPVTCINSRDITVAPSPGSSTLILSCRWGWCLKPQWFGFHIPIIIPLWPVSFAERKSKQMELEAFLFSGALLLLFLTLRCCPVVWWSVCLSVAGPRCVELTTPYPLPTQHNWTEKVTPYLWQQCR